MALVVTQRARQAIQRQGAWRWAPFAAVLAAVLLHAPGARAAEDEFVPGGTWTVRATVTQEHQDAAIASNQRLRPLADWLMHKPGLSEDLSGDVTRDVTTTETLIGFGISDTWNLNLVLPYKVIRQSSTLGTSSTDPLALEAVDRLKTETVSGLGNVRLLSLHRPAYSDTTSIILGWGFSVPGGPQQNDYVGKTTLDARMPYNTLTGLFHYTGYPQGAAKARFDLRFALDLGLQATVKMPSENK
ncbi:MAG TPA: hypothetical protein VF678_15905, partial [bacterium]